MKGFEREKVWRHGRGCDQTMDVRGGFRFRVAEAGFTTTGIRRKVSYYVRVAAFILLPLRRGE